jgi:hypothetical protein
MFEEDFLNGQLGVGGALIADPTGAYVFQFASSAFIIDKISGAVKRLERVV